jgi:hypothetical protein
MSFELDLTYDCNLHCKWCNRLCGTRFRKPDRVSLEIFERNIHAIESHVDNQTGIKVIGGEPTLHPQIIDMLDLLLKYIRPKMRFAIDIYTNGVGPKIQKVLNQIRAKYSTYTLFGSLSPDISKRATSDKQFYIVVSKASITGSFSVGMHESVYKAAQDMVPEMQEDYSQNCRIHHYCGYGVTPNGIFICSIAPAIATIFKLKGGLDRFPTLQEENEQKQLYCKYCYAPCTYSSKGLKPDTTPTYEKAFIEWDKEPYYLPLV